MVVPVLEGAPLKVRAQFPIEPFDERPRHRDSLDVSLNSTLTEGFPS